MTPAPVVHFEPDRGRRTACGYPLATAVRTHHHAEAVTCQRCRRKLEEARNA